MNWCIIIAFFATFLFFKNYRLIFNFFQVVKMRIKKLKTHLYHFEEGWNATQSYCDVKRIFWRWNNQQKVERWFKLASQIKKQEFGYQISMIRHLSNRGWGWMSENQIVDYRLQCGSFNFCSSSQKTLESTARWIPHQLCDRNKAKHIQRKSLHSGWIVTSSKISKERFAFLQMFHPNEYRKASTV